MPDVKGLDIPPPENHQDFESLLLDLLTARFTPVVESSLRGTNGQAQGGVDLILQLRDGLHGYQFKRVVSFSAKKFDAELALADAASVQLRSFTVLTTSKADRKIQEHVEQTSLTRVSQGRFAVSIVFWTTIRDWLGNHQDVLGRHYPSLLPRGFAYEYELARIESAMEAGREQDGRRELRELILRADTEGAHEWASKARLSLVWNLLKPPQPEMSEAPAVIARLDEARASRGLPRAVALGLLRAKARIAVYMRRPEDAATYLDEVVASESPGDPRVTAQRARALLDLAMLSAGRERFEDALALLLRVAAVDTRLCSQADKDSIRNSTLEVRLRVAIATGDETTTGEIVGALSTPSDHAATDYVCRVLIIFANFAMSARQFPCALVCAQGAAAFGRAVGIDNYVVGAEHICATILHLAGRSSEAVRINAEVATRAERRGDQTIAASAHLSAAEWALERGDSAVAMERAQAALRLAAGGDPEELAIRTCLADACALAGDTTEAERHIAEVVRLAGLLGAPVEFRDDLLYRATMWASYEGLWERASEYLASWDHLPAPPVDAERRDRSRANVAGLQHVHATLATVREQGSAAPRSSDDLRSALAEVVRPLYGWWDDVGGDAPPWVLDYWGRGNCMAALRCLAAHPRALTFVVEARTVAEIERAIRMCGLVADAIVVLWKGAATEGWNRGAFPLAHGGAGGAGYLVAAGTIFRAPNGSKWCSAMAHGRLVPDDVARLMAGPARAWGERGALLVVPASEVGCVHPGFGAVERLLTAAIRGVPIVSGTGPSAVLPIVPYFPNISLEALADVAGDPHFDRRALRRLLVRLTAQYGQSAAAEVERIVQEEIEDEVEALRSRLARPAARHGWTLSGQQWMAGGARNAPPVPEAAPPTGTAVSPFQPFLRVGALGAGWQMTGLRPSSDRVPGNETDENRSHGTWLASPDERPRFLTLSPEADGAG